jgi:hypothetical protein
MIHYSCDRCKRVLDSDEEVRYVVKVEVYAAMEPLDVDDIEDDRDHLLEIQEILERLEDGQSDAISDDVYQKQRYDLCSDCYKEYVKNPLGRDVSVHLDFSPN